jgi:hypothetical protein
MASVKPDKAASYIVWGKRADSDSNARSKQGINLTSELMKSEETGYANSAPRKQTPAFQKSSRKSEQ